MITNKMEKNQGLTLIESLVVVGILLGIVAIALTLYGTVRDRLNVKNESENISFIFSQTVDLFSDEETSDIGNELAVQAGIIPKKMKISNGEDVFNSWGGRVDIKPNGSNGFLLTYKKVPSGSVCVDMIRNQRKVGWDAYKTEKGGTDYSKLKNSTLVGHCDSSNDYIDVDFTYGESSSI
ncbi:MAG: prepilin-type N-terminal cleavage/methylation domain-containing protein [Pseudomonas sp.]|nr:prepilin-type N-terminal cleavage/methylation domain-containing protein [Pseudomonas sp.]RCL48706.1 MAG: prepilin-type N-terminal cleavage/methylation domain-containing protein [Pseudomonas sp.]